VAGCDAIAERHYSPNGNWVVVECLNGKTGVYLKDTSIVWVLPYEMVFEKDDEWNESGSLFPSHWSNDGRYLFLSAYPKYVDWSCGTYARGIALFRLDLVTGEASKMLTVVDTTDNYYFYGFSFSDDDSYFVYYQTWLEHPVFNIQNIATGEEQTISLGMQYDGAGDVVWSPDKNKIVFSARVGTECENFVYSVVMMDMSDFSQTTLMADLSEYYEPVEWPDANYILLGENDSKKYYTFDLLNRQLLDNILPTPMPEP
jgi:hypothetical protein